MEHKKKKKRRKIILSNSFETEHSKRDFKIIFRVVTIFFLNYLILSETVYFILCIRLSVFYFSILSKFFILSSKDFQSNHFIEHYQRIKVKN